MNYFLSFTTLKLFLKAKIINRSEMEEIAERGSDSSCEEEMDSHGIECEFLYGFLTADFEMNFWNIAAVYLKHRYVMLDDYMKEGWLNADEINQTTPEEFPMLRILNLMLNGAKAGDKYSRTLLVNLYAVYHEDEYRKLKKFKKISANDIIGMMGDNSEFSICTVSRIIVMSRLMGIETDETCKGFHDICNKAREEAEEEFKDAVVANEYDPERRRWISQCIDEMIKEYEGDPEKMYEYEEQARDFVNLCLGCSFFPKDYDLNCRDMMLNRNIIYVNTFIYLRKAFPNERVTFKKLQEFSVLYRLADSFTWTLHKMDNSIYKLLGIWHSRYWGEMDWSMKISPEKLEEGLEEGEK